MDLIYTWYGNRYWSQILEAASALMTIPWGQVTNLELLCWFLH